MKEIFYVEMKDYRNNIDWSPIGAFTSKEAARSYTNRRNEETEGRVYIVQ